MRTGEPTQLVKNVWEEVTETHTVEAGAATWISTTARHTTEEVAAKRAEEWVTRQRAANKAARLAAQVSMAPALPASVKQGIQGGGWFSKVGKAGMAGGPSKRAGMEGARSGFDHN